MAHSESFWGQIRSWAGGEPQGKRRRSRALEPSVDMMEDRVVLSRIGFSGARFGHGEFHRGGHDRDSGVVQDAQLTTELAKLKTDTQAVVAGSTVTDAQRQALGMDLKSIAKTGFRVGESTLQPVVESLLTSLADGSYANASSGIAAQNQADFTALFSGSSVDSALIAQTYTHLVDVARNMNISTDELNTLAADRAAIEASLTRLGIPTNSKKADSLAELVLSPGFGRFRGRRF